MTGRDLRDLNTHVEVAAKHAFEALLKLEKYRLAPDPSDRAAYQAVHELISDLGAVRAEIAFLMESYQQSRSEKTA